MESADIVLIRAKCVAGQARLLSTVAWVGSFGRRHSCQLPGLEDVGHCLNDRPQNIRVQFADLGYDQALIRGEELRRAGKADDAQRTGGKACIGEFDRTCVTLAAR